MMLAESSRGQRALTSPQEAAGMLPIRSGREVAALAEALYLRMFVVALGGMEIICGFAILAALARTRDVSFVRTTALAVALALLAALALRNPAPWYLAMRRRPALSLVAPVLALGALAIDGVSHSPLSFPAAVSIAFPAFVCGRRWALAAATLISVGAVTAATVRMGWGALNSVGQGTVAYFVWALVLAGLADRFAQLAMRMPQTDVSATTAPEPVRVANLAGAPPPSRPGAPNPTVAAESASEVATSARLTPRQLQVVALLADGLRADDIAQRLGIATSSVYRYVARAKERTGVASGSELVALAIREGLVPPGTVARDPR